VSEEIVDRLFDGLSGGQGRHLRREQIEIEGVGVIPIDVLALLGRQVCEIPVIGIHVDERHRRVLERVGNPPRDGGLAGARAASKANNERLHSLRLDGSWRGRRPMRSEDMVTVG
jgi:hypothetical protein